LRTNLVGRLYNALDFNKADGHGKQICNQDMRRKKKTTIVTVEARERTTIRRGARQMIAWCDQCGAEVSMVTPNEAAALAGTEARAIFRALESGEVHFIETGEGALLICAQSLAGPSTKHSSN